MANPLHIQRIPRLRINAQTGTTYTLSPKDHGSIITFNNASSITVTVPQGLGKGFVCEMIELGAGRIALAPATGVTAAGKNYAFRTNGVGAKASLEAYGEDLLNFFGDVQSISFPSEAATCQFWFDASDAQKVTQAADVISQVTDGSASAFNVTQTGTAQPTYQRGGYVNRNVILFDGSNDWMGTTGASALRGVAGYTLFSVHKPTSFSSQKTTLSVSGTATKFAFNTAITTGVRSLGVRRTDAEGGGVVTGSAATLNVWEQVCGVVDFSITTGTLYVNGVQDGINTSLSTVGVSDSTNGDIYVGSGIAGASNWYAGQIAELMLFPSALSTLWRQRIEGYLRTKWSLPD